MRSRTPSRHNWTGAGTFESTVEPGRQLMKNYIKCGKCGKIHNVGNKKFKLHQRMILNKLARGVRKHDQSGNWFNNAGAGAGATFQADHAV